MTPHPLRHFVFSKLSHCSSALLCLLRCRISLPLIQPPDYHVSSSHLQDFILDFCWFSFSSWAPDGWLLLLTQFSAQMPFLSQPALSACVICPHLHMRLFAYLFTCSLSVPSSWRKFHQDRDFVGFVPGTATMDYMLNGRDNPMRIPIVISII